MTAGVRAAALLTVGMGLWVLFGAVRGAADWQVSGGGYVVGLLLAGLAFGLPAPVGEPRHLATAGLLVVPGAATLVAAGPGAHPDAAWWFVTLLFGLLGAAGTHRLVVELRRALAPVARRRRSRRLLRRRRVAGRRSPRRRRVAGRRSPRRRRVAGRRSALADGPHNG